MGDVVNVEKKIIAASGQATMDTLISKFNGFEFLGVVDYREDLFDKCKELMPDILVVSDSIGGKGSLPKTLLKIRTELNSIRIVYFCGRIDFSDTIRVNSLNMLIGAGIYDIIPESKMEVELIRFVLNNPRSIENVDFIEAKNIDSIYGSKPRNAIEITAADEDINSDLGVYKNLVTFMSSKSGTGKSLLLSNIAVAIANLGYTNKEGHKPKIALIDLDLAGFNLSNIFDTYDKERNLPEAVYQAHRILNDEGVLLDKKSAQAEVIDNIKRMFIPTKKYANIKILGGPEGHFQEEDSTNLNQNDLVFIIEAIIDDYDLVLVDMNSDIEYTKTFPLFSISKDIYSVIEFSFNSLSNNTRLENHIASLLSSQKVKYVLNKNLKETSITDEDLKELLKINFVAQIPYVDPLTIFETDYKKDFIINNSNKELFETRYEILKFANDIWPIRNFDKLTKKIESILGKESEIEEVKNKDKKKENKVISFVKKSLGIDEEDTKQVDKIAEELKNTELKEKLEKGINDFKQGIKTFTTDLNEKLNSKKKEEKEEPTENTEGQTEENTENKDGE